jgi:ubiquinone/menaquinone biosynthesis C-methylase UbiE
VSTQKVLEIGAGDGSHTVKYASKVKSLVALDVAASLLNVARQRTEKANIANVEFVVKSVLELESTFSKNEFDCVISERCIINLPSWETQKSTIRQVYDVLKPGGLFLVTEGFQDELENLSDLRAQVGLERIKVAINNRNFIHSEFDPLVAELFIVEAIKDYGFYLMLSRVYHPLMILPNQPRHGSKFNEVATLLSEHVSTTEFGKYSYNLFYVLKKK